MGPETRVRVLERTNRTLQGVRLQDERFWKATTNSVRSLELRIGATRPGHSERAVHSLRCVRRRVGPEPGVLQPTVATRDLPYEGSHCDNPRRYPSQVARPRLDRSIFSQGEEDLHTTSAKEAHADNASPST